MSAIAEAAFGREKTLFTSKLDLNSRKEVEMLHLQHSNVWCWRRSVGPIVGGSIKYYIESRRRGIAYIQQKEGRLTGLVTYGVGTVFYNTFLKEREE